MNKTLIFRKIGGIISELTEQYQYLAENPESINPLELELFIANSHFLAEHLAILKKLESSPELLNQNNSSVKSIQIEATADPVPDLYIELPPNEEVADSGETDARAVAVSDGEWFRPEPQALRINDEEAGASPEVAEEAELKIVSVPEVPAPSEESYQLPVESISPFSAVNLPGETAKDQAPDLIEIKEIQPGQNEADGKVPTLNEILSASMNKENIAAKISSREDKDLKSMIKLNDKLMFVRDLFGGYNLAYSEAIELVNRFDSFTAAENFLKQNYAVKNKWSEKQATVDQFYEILNRRFS